MKRFPAPRSALTLVVLPAAAVVVLALTGGFVDARQSSLVPAPVLPSEDAETDPALAWVDPVITGPVSPRYRLQREAAGCDEATWPHIPAICFPQGVAER